MSKIDVIEFRGQIPRIDTHLLPNPNAFEAVNTKLWKGTIAPFRGVNQVETPSKSGVIKSIYRFAPVSGDDGSGYWFHWNTDVDVIRGPVKGDTSERTYYTGDGVPKVTDNSIALSGGTDYPENSYTLGVPVPTTTLAVGKSGAPDSGMTEADNISRSYVMTFVTAWGDEGPPTDPSDDIDLLPGEMITVSNLGSAPAGNYNIATKRIYRTATGGSETDYYFVDEIPVSQASYDDSIPDSVIGLEVPSETWYQPPSDMHSIGMLDNGICYGASKNELHVSEAGLPHAWSPFNSHSSNYPIVGIGSLQNNIVGLTEKNPLVVSGTDPSSMSARELKINQGCISKRSIVSGKFGVVYSSPDGLVLISNQSIPSVVTSEFLTRDQWQELNPHSITGVLYNQMYLGFYDNGSEQRGFIFDPSNAAAGFFFIDVFPSAVYSDALSDNLFLMIGSDIVTWDTGSALTYSWKSKSYLFDRVTNMTAVKITAKDYSDITFKSYVDGVLTRTAAVTNNKVFRIPYKCGEKFEFQVEGTSEIERVQVAEAAQELVR